MARDLESAAARVTSASEMAHDHLKDAILSGMLQPGQPLKQEVVAAQLGLSRAPVREALNQLEREGLVVLRPRRGFVVAELAVEEIEEIFQIRMMLEEHAARIAAEKRTLEDVANARRLLRSMERISTESPSGIAQWAALNREFHGVISRASGLKRVHQLTANLRDVVEHYVRLDAATTRRTGKAHEEHKQIVEAFAAGDADGVARLVRLHCQHSCERLIATMKRLKKAG